MSRRIAYLALAAAALIATPSFAEPRSHAPGSRHVAHQRHLPAFSSLAAPVTIVGNSHARPVASTTVVVEPWVLTDPAWQLCQIDAPAGRTYLCGPYSYHPFGAYGHRPFGAYRPSRSAPDYLFAPRARIIRIDTDD